MRVAQLRIGVTPFGPDIAEFPEVRGEKPGEYRSGPPRSSQDGNRVT